MYRPKNTQERILHRLKIAHGHLKKCAADAISSGKRDEAIAEVMQVFKKAP